MKKTVLTFGGIATIAAILRLFTRQIFEPIGVPTIVGSMLASVSIVLLAGMSILFVREGRKSDGRYWRAAAWFVLLAVWCELLVIGGILATEHFHLNSYYTGPWEMVRHLFPTAASHAIGHAQGFWVRTPFLMIVGAVVYWVAKRR